MKVKAVKGKVVQSVGTTLLLINPLEDTVNRRYIMEPEPLKPVEFDLSDSDWDLVKKSISNLNELEENKEGFCSEYAAFIAQSECSFQSVEEFFIDYESEDSIIPGWNPILDLELVISYTSP